MNQFDNQRDLDRAALCGEPSYVWRVGQERRLRMILESAGERIKGDLLENGCGVGMYVDHLAPLCRHVIGLEYELNRAKEAQQETQYHDNVSIVGGAGENLPFEDQVFDLILSHEVLEHVQDDRLAVQEMVRVLRPGGRMVVFVPNKGYPFETHGIYIRGKYHFGNKLFVNYLPRKYRDNLAPHVRVYSVSDLTNMFEGLPVHIITRSIIYGAYDNIIYRWPKIGIAIREVLYRIEKTPLKIFGLSHFWVVEKHSQFIGGGEGSTV